MHLASILDQYHDAFQAKYGSQLLPGHLRAIDAIGRCRTPDAGQLFVQCPSCRHSTWQPLSCGHRNCPQCQNHEASLWLDRQQAKLLPVAYFLVTFTLPYEFALAKVFRARLLDALKKSALDVPNPLPVKWVVDGTHAGRGQPALRYLSRYLYRGVISENNVVSNQNGKVTFKYFDSRTGKANYRMLKGEDFLWLVLQHVLPKGFRRVRDYGFLHGNAKKLLSLVQMVLQVLIESCAPRPRLFFKCPMCQAPMKIILFMRPAWTSG
jgi:hypothetical protein